jgi:hypothetical protein
VCVECYVLKAGVAFITGDSTECVSNLTKALDMRSRESSSSPGDNASFLPPVTAEGEDALSVSSTQYVKNASEEKSSESPEDSGKAAASLLDHGKSTEFKHRKDMLECLVSVHRYFSLFYHLLNACMCVCHSSFRSTTIFMWLTAD